MKFRIILILSVLLFSLQGRAQPAETISQGNIVVDGASDDDSFGPFNIGFTFQFFGNNYTQFYVNSNGMILFGAGSLDPTAVSIPNAAVPNNYIAPFWDDLIVDASAGKILYKTIGTVGPNRKCVIQFLNMGFYPRPVFMGTFSIVLYETTNIIQVQYRIIVDDVSVKAHGSTATIGIENASGTAGVQYSFQNPTAVTSEQAISFTPSGPTYIINSSAGYEGIYLTENQSLPEPSIPQLINPAQDAIIGQNQTFEWNAASDASSYTFLLSYQPDLADAIAYDAGTNLFYDITGLTLDTTYYWSVFPSNLTGTTWSKIKKFKTSSTPPLAPSPETVWIEQGQERSVQLDYTGGDASAKTAIITSLPASGVLYQYDAGAHGALISSVPTTLTDTERKVIYVASGTTGNGAGNFNFKIHDNTGDSPEATTTVNVSPPGVPNLINAARSTTVELQFDRIMNDPAGKQNQFTVKVNSSPVTINSAGLKTGDPYTIILTLATPLAGPETVLISYTKGTVSATTGGLLESFSNFPVVLLAQTITFTINLTKKYGDAPFALSATATSGLSMTYSSSNPSVAQVPVNILTIYGVGTSDITARQAGDATYAPAKYIRTLTVSKGDQIITFNTLPVKTVGDADFSPGATASSGLTVSYSSDNSAVATIVGSMIHIVGAGTAVITASQAGNTLWNPATSVPQTLNVGKANQTITFAALPVKTFGESDFNPGATASSGLTVSYASGNTDVATIIGGMIHIVGAGTAVITASQAGNTNYNPATDVPQTLTVNKANQTITFGALADKTYGDPDYSLTATSSSGLTVSYSSDNLSVATVAGNSVHIVGAGTAVITASQAGDANYNAATSVPQTLTVNKATQTITFTDYPEHLLVAESHTLAATSSGGVTVLFESANDNIATVSGNEVTGVGKGSVEIRAYNSGDQNYLPAEAFITITVSSAHKDIIHLFTPNNDGFNDLWELPELQTWGKCEVRVFSRSGKVVFADDNYNNTWDGTSNGNPVPEGAYYFVIKTENAGTVKGTVNIVR